MLPKIETPKHELTLPVSGKKISFRPFLVKEQKVLLQSIEMGDEEQTQNAIKDIAEACTYNKFDIDELAVADVEYLVINLRRKSIGETIEATYKCNNCGTKFPVQIDLSNIEVTEFDRDNRIMLTDDIGVVMKPITYRAIKKAIEQKSDVDKAYSTVLDSIEMVFDKDQTYTDFTDVELFEFLESISTKAFEKIEKYIESQPTIYKKVDVKCPKCGEEQEIELKGLSDFLE